MANHTCPHFYPTHDVFPKQHRNYPELPPEFPNQFTKTVWLQPIIEKVSRILKKILPQSIRVQTDIDLTCAGIKGDCELIERSIISLACHVANKYDNQGILEIRLKRKQGVPNSDIAQTLPDSRETACLIIKVSGANVRRASPSPSQKGCECDTGGAQKEMSLPMNAEDTIRALGGYMITRTTAEPALHIEIRLPIRSRSQRKGQRKKERTVSDQGKGRVLFVDDEEMIVRMGKRLLSRHGFDVTAMSSSSEALQVFCGNPEQFDVVVTDQTMPDLSGIEFSRELLSVRPDIPVVLFSGYSDLVDALAAKAAGIREYLVKPMGIDSLASSLKRIMGERESQVDSSSPST